MCVPKCIKTLINCVTIIIIELLLSLMGGGIKGEFRIYKRQSRLCACTFYPVACQSLTCEIINTIRSNNVKV